MKMKYDANCSLLAPREKLLLGSKFSIRNHASIVHGGCMEFLSAIPDNSIQLVITSPPYNIGKEYEQRLDIHEYVSQQRMVINECVRVLRGCGSICWETGNYIDRSEIVPLDILLYDCFKANRLQLRNRIVWHFGHGLHCKRRFSGRYETILWFTKSDNYVFNLDAVRQPQKYPGKRHFKGPNAGKYSGNPRGKNPSDVWLIPNVKSNHVEKTDHPCQFPVSLVQRLILALSDEGDVVLDPFLGVGTTAVAGILNGRRVAGSEVVREYYEAAIERIVLAYEGRLKVRPDVPVYEPTGNLSIMQNPFVIKGADGKCK